MLVSFYYILLKVRTQHPYFIKFVTEGNCKVTNPIKMSIIVETLAESL